MLLYLLILLGGRPILPDEVVAILLVSESHICRRREGLVHRLLQSTDHVHGGYSNYDRCKNGHKEHTHRRLPFLDADHAITRKAHVGFRFQARLAKRLAMKPCTYSLHGAQLQSVMCLFTAPCGMVMWSISFSKSGRATPSRTISSRTIGSSSISPSVGSRLHATQCVIATSIPRIPPRGI